MASVHQSLRRAIEQHQAGDLAAAEHGYLVVVEEMPERPEAWHLLGLLADQQGRVEEAIRFLARAIAIAPRDPSARVKLGEIHDRLGNSTAAIVQYGAATRADPQLAKAWYYLGNAAQRLGRLQEAERALRRCVDLQPSRVEAINDLAGVLQSQGRYTEAIEWFGRAATLAADHADLHCNLGAALYAANRLTEAADSFRRALEIDKSHALARLGLAKVHAAGGRIGEAAIQLRQALSKRPDHLLWNLRCDTLRSPVFSSRQEIDATLAEHRATLARYEITSQRLYPDEIPHSGCYPPEYLAYQHQDVRPIKQAYAGIFRQWVEAAAPSPGTDKPKVGFLVTAGHEGVFFRGMSEVVRRLPRDRFDVTLFLSSSGTSHLPKRLANGTTEIVALPQNFLQQIEAIRAARCDFLYFWEIGTDATNYFLPLFRVASVQCTSWGWPVTSGMDRVDYFLSSDLLEAADADAHYTENLICLKTIPNYYAIPQVAGVTPCREEFGLRPEDHIYLCVQNLLKVHPDLDQLWDEILLRDPSGTILLIESPHKHVSELIRNRLTRTMPNTFNRVQIMPWRSVPEYLNLIASADVVLDTLHYGGGANTTYDVLALGVPLITLPTQFHRGRYAAAAYRKLGVEDCVAGSPAEYVRLALHFAGEPDARQQVGRRIAEASEVLFEDKAAISQLADFFESAITTARER